MPYSSTKKSSSRFNHLSMISLMLHAMSSFPHNSTSQSSLLARCGDGNVPFVVCKSSNSSLWLLLLILLLPVILKTDQLTTNAKNVLYCRNIFVAVSASVKHNA